MEQPHGRNKETLDLMDPLNKMIQERDVESLVSYFFGVELTPLQAKIVRVIAYEESKKITVRAPTQWGKTMSVGFGFALNLLFNSSGKYRLIASLTEKTGILRNYIADDIIKCPLLYNQLEMTNKGINRLKAEVSKKRLTFKDGKDLSVHTAEGDALRLMGHGGNKIGVDETGEITEKVFVEMIMRMVGGYSDDYMIIEIGNPWDPNTHFKKHWDDPRTPDEGGWLKIHITWQDAVREGRFTQEYIDERRRELTPMAFRVLYDAEFPEEAEDQLIRMAWIQSALNKNMKLGNTTLKAGMDVAEMGLDSTVLISGDTDKRHFKVNDIFSWKKMDTMPSVGKLREYLPNKNYRVNVDATGVGSGVYSRLKEIGYNAYPYKGGENPSRKTEQELYRNKLAEWYWKLRKVFEEERIDLSELKKKPVLLKNLVSQLTQITYEVQSDRLIKINKPDKSPDYADALMLFTGDVMTMGISI